MMSFAPKDARVLITGGAGFIGSHLADELIRSGYQVRVLDALSPQVHSENASRPAYLNNEAELIVGDVREPKAVHAALQGVEFVIHLAAAVGVGQSMYAVVDYTDTNDLGTAVLLEALIERPVQRLIVASSMSIYGEGLYQAPDGTVHVETQRSMEQLRRGEWELRGEHGQELAPIPTPESKRPSLASVYALNKFNQEQLCLLIGRAYDIQTVALRLFNVYGTRQALSNPYTGVLAIFLSRLRNGRPPLIYEDGRQQRDFVSVYDVARAFRLALETPAAGGEIFNIGSGQRISVIELARQAAAAVGKPYVEPHVTGRYRAGDIRHCFADISKAQRVLGYQPQVKLDQGLQELAAWLEDQVAHDRVDQADRELSMRGLTV